MLNWLLRYQPVIDILNADGATSVLDVGSGWFGLSFYWPGDVVQTDWQFDGAPPSISRPGRPLFIRSSAERLPFVDDAFRHVVSVDMIEHLPEELRLGAIRELMRVSAHTIILAHPFGPRARRTDIWLAACLDKLPGRSRPPWLVEHLAQSRYPDEQLLRAAVAPGWYVDNVAGIGNSRLQGLIVLAEELPVLRRVMRLLEERLRTRKIPSLVNRGETYRRLYVLRKGA